jgi:hypothetical protein
MRIGGAGGMGARGGKEHLHEIIGAPIDEQAQSHKGDVYVKSH